MFLRVRCCCGVVFYDQRRKKKCRPKKCTVTLIGVGWKKKTVFWKSCDQEKVSCPENSYNTKMGVVTVAGRSLQSLKKKRSGTKNKKNQRRPTTKKKHSKKKLTPKQNRVNPPILLSYDIEATLFHSPSFLPSLPPFPLASAS